MRQVTRWNIKLFYRNAKPCYNNNISQMLKIRRMTDAEATDYNACSNWARKSEQKEKLTVEVTCVSSCTARKARISSAVPQTDNIKTTFDFIVTLPLRINLTLNVFANAIRTKLEQALKEEQNGYGTGAERIWKKHFLYNVFSRTSCRECTGWTLSKERPSSVRFTCTCTLWSPHL